VLDVSSSDLIIPNETPRRQQVPPLHAFNSSRSSTYRPNGTQIASDPLSIKTSGILSQDLLSISDLQLPNILFEEATFLDLNDCIYCNWNFDTVFPLGLYNSTAPRNFMSPVAKLIEGEYLDENIFSLRMTRTVDDIAGQLIIGGRLDPSYLDGEEVTLPVISINRRSGEEEPSNKHWNVAADELILGDGSAIRYQFENSTIAVLQTTFFWMSLPTSLSKRLNKFLESKNWGPFPFVDCKKRPHWPDITIVLGGEKLVLTPYDYIIEQNEGGRISCLSAFFPSYDDEAPIIYLGSAFLKTFVTVWDWDHHTVGCKCPAQNNQNERS